MLEGKVIRLLLIEDEEYDVGRVLNTIKPFGERIVVRDVVADGNRALALLRQNPKDYDVVIMDFQIAGGVMGEQLIREVKVLDPAIQIIVITKMTVNITDFDFASRLINAGAFWYCTKYPVDVEEYIYQPTDFLLSIINAYQKKEMETERLHSTRKFARTIDRLLEQKKILGASPAIQDVIQQVHKGAESNANILITGLSGTGKELVAQNIHYMGQRRFENFVPINCGSIPAELMESELFGYEKGAFTGASSRKLGLFEVANHGTLFLDEVGELPPQAQVKLLRVLQEGEIEKIGRMDKVKVDVRIIAATNKDLKAEVSDKRFREDLFYRLNVVQIDVPALRDHREDIPSYIEHFLTLLCEEANRRMPVVEPAALKVFLVYEWPGNVRELKNVLQRLLFVNDDVITAASVEIALGQRTRRQEDRTDLSIHFGEPGSVIPWRKMERDLREKYFRFVRANTSSDREAATKLGLAPPNYHRMCKELGIK
jgi:two-component system response regulator AtoC